MKKIVCYDSLLQVPFYEEKSVRLFRVAFFRSDFLKNPYFNGMDNEWNVMRAFLKISEIIGQFLADWLNEFRGIWWYVFPVELSAHLLSLCEASP